jgi:hypothetical protein
MRRAALLLAALALAPPAAAARDVRFGSSLAEEPTGFDPPETCDTSPSDFARDDGPCTRVAVGFGAGGAVAGRVTAPADGVIRRVTLRAGAPGTLRVKLVRLKDVSLADGTGSGQAASSGALVHVRGKVVESFRVRLVVHKGDYLAAEGGSFTVLRCAGDAVQQLLFNPTLALGADFAPAHEHDTCTLLLQATITRR